MLSPEEVAQYHETGQVTAAFRLDEDIVSAVVERAGTLFAARPDLDHDYIPNTIETDPDGNWIEFGIQAQILDSVAQLLGENIILWGSAFLVTSKGLCQGEEGGHSLGCVFVGEDGEQDAVH